MSEKLPLFVGQVIFSKKEMGSTIDKVKAMYMGAVSTYTDTMESLTDYAEWAGLPKDKVKVLREDLAIVKKATSAPGKCYVWAVVIVSDNVLNAEEKIRDPEIVRLITAEVKGVLT